MSNRMTFAFGLIIVGIIVAGITAGIVFGVAAGIVVLIIAGFLLSSLFSASTTLRPSSEKINELVSMLIAPFVVSPEPVVRRLLTLAELKPGEILYDLGAGDGRPIIVAAQEFGARAVGIELREDLAKQAMKKIYDLGLQDKIKIINEDLFKIDLSQADVVYLYLTTSANDKVKPKLEAELKKGARVVSHDYEIIGWKTDKVEHYSENRRLRFPTQTLYLYKIR